MTVVSSLSGTSKVTSSSDVAKVTRLAQLPVLLGLQVLPWLLTLLLRAFNDNPGGGNNAGGINSGK